jgi:hypothetical protein
LVEIIWLCGQYKSGEVPNVIWEIQGVFSSKGKALSACRNRNYFIAPLEIDKEFPDETTEPLSGVEYPLS